MHVHIDQRADRSRRTVPPRDAGPGLGHRYRRRAGPEQQLVRTGRPLTNRNCATAAPARIGGQGGIAGQVEPVAFCINRSAFSAKSRPSTVRSRPCSASNRSPVSRIGAEHHAAVAIRRIAQDEGDKGFRHRQPLDAHRHRLRLCPVGAQEFQAGGGGDRTCRAIRPPCRWSARQGARR